MKRHIAWFTAAALLVSTVSPGLAKAPAAAKPLASGNPACYMPPLTKNDITKVTGLSDGGSVCGTYSGNAAPYIYTYKGIPYATAGLWQGPQPPTPISGEYRATKFGSECPQATPGDTGNADCLYLNVWAPKANINNPSAKLPVMVFIHGGAFLFGSGSAPSYSGIAMAKQGSGIVVVTLNYRLGALGFMAGNVQGVSSNGNFGLMDQVAALQWVQANIGRFGGDKTNVTLFGESAGAESVGLHLFDMSVSSTLFKKAIMESNPMGVSYLNLAAAQTNGNAFLNYLCKTYGGSTTGTCTGNWLSTVTASQIVAAQTAYASASAKAAKSSPAALKSTVNNVESTQVNLPWAPTADGSYVKAQPYAGYATGMSPKPFAFGVNQNEGALFAAILNGALWKGGAGTPTPAQYSALLTSLFGTQTINGQPALTAIMALQRYNPASSVNSKASGNFYSAAGAALANVVTDQTFVCGNLNAAQAAHSKFSSSPIYAYEFTQVPFFDIYNLGKTPPKTDAGACAPSTTAAPTPNNVCHANEVPYVFKTANLIPLVAPYYQLNGTDASLAIAMNAAWAQFAISDTAPLGWVSYDTTKGVQQWNGTTSAPIDLDAQSNCSTIWQKLTPYH